MDELTPEQLASLTKDDQAELTALSQEANENVQAIAQTSAFRLKLALAGARAATYAVILMNLLVKLDGRSALGKATANALAAFALFSDELNKEIEAAKQAAAAQEAQEAPEVEVS